VKYGNIVIAQTKETVFIYTVATSGSHTFTVRARNFAGFYSSALNLTKTIQAEPADVATLSVEQNALDRRILKLSWSAVVDSDLSHYEIRKGNNWGAASLVATNVKGLTYEFPATQEETATFLIKAVTTGGVGSVNAKSVSLSIALKPSNPSNGSVVADPNNKSTLVISWQSVSDTDLVNYEVRLGTDWNTGTLVSTTRENSIKHAIMGSGSYSIMVCSKNVVGIYSSPLNLTYFANVEPLDVTGFSASQFINDHSKVRLSWNVVSDKDVAYYEIREGGTWDTASVIGTRITGLFYDTTITTERLYTYLIKAYNIAGKSSINPAVFSSVFDMNPSTPQTLTIEKDPNDKSLLNISWSGVSDIDLLEYELKVGDSWESAQAVVRTKELRNTYKPPSSGPYKFLLKAKNVSGFYSDEVSSQYTACIEPADVTGFSAVQNGEYVLMTWSKSNEADVVGYEIREGAVFDNGAALVVTGLSETTFSVKIDTETTRRYHVKAINRAGYYSRQAASANVTITGLLPKNVVFDYDEIVLQNGTHNNTEFGASQYDFSNFGGRFSDYPTIRFNEIGGQQVLKLQPRSLIDDYHFNDGIDLGQWSGYSGGTVVKNAAGNLLYTAASTVSTGIKFKLPIALERNTTYVVEIKHKTSKTGLSAGFIGAGGGYAASNCTPTSRSMNCPTANVWATEKMEFTVGSSGVEPTYFLFCYGAKVAGDTSEIEYAKIYKKSGQNGIYTFMSSGEYLLSSKDMGQVITANIASDFVSSVLLAGGVTAKLQYRTSRDGNIWSDWQDFKPVYATFRYLEFKVILATEDIEDTPEVNVFKIRVDVPDTDRVGTTVVAAGGSTILYGHTYWQNPSVLPQAIGSGLRAELLSIGKNGFAVKVLNSSNVDVGGTITWIARGY
jgi:hypothetical protein